MGWAFALYTASAGAQDAAVPAGAQDDATAESVPEVTLAAIPYPDMDGLEDAVREQINDAHAFLQNWLRQDGAPAPQVSAAFGRLGQILHAYELYEAAEACYVNAFILDSKNFLWLYLLGHLYQQSGEFEAAVDFYGKSLLLQPENLAARVHLGEVYLAQNLSDMAAAEFRQALEMDPENPAARAHLGEIALANGNHQEAVELLSGVVSRIPGANRLNYPLGMAYRGLGELDKARQHLAQAGAVGITVEDPLIDAMRNLATGERVHLVRGRAAFAAQRYAEAVGEFRKALQADPQSARVRVNLGSALGELGDPLGALEQYQEALKIDPKNVTAHFNAGVLHGQEGNYEKAAEHFQAAVELKFDDGEAHRRLGLMLYRLGRKDEAAHELDEATSLQPTDEKAWLDEATVLLELGRFKDALEGLELALRILPQSGGISHALARILATCPDPSLRDGPRALELAQLVYDARQTPTHGITVALALAEVDRCDDAAQWLAGIMQVAEEAGANDWVAGQRPLLERFQGGPPCRSGAVEPLPHQGSPR